MFIVGEQSNKIILRRSKSTPLVIIGILGIVLIIWLISTSIHTLFSSFDNTEGKISIFSILWSVFFITISYYALRICLYLAFSYYSVEINKADSSIKIKQRNFLRIIETQLERKDLIRLEIFDPNSELRRRLGAEVPNSAYTFYDLNLIPTDTRMGRYRIYASSDFDSLRIFAEKIASLMKLKLEIKASKSIYDLPLPENPIPTDGPVLNAIFEEKVEFRDLYYNFYRAVAEEEDKIILAPIESTKVYGPTGPGIDEWHMPITTSPSFKNRKKVIIDKNSFKDASGNTYSRWDGGKRPCRYV